jgi:hypothetical protein
MPERRDILNDTKKKKKERRDKKKLSHTVNTLAAIIDTIATSMKGDIDGGEEWDLKQLKELTGAAKEISALISSLSEKEGEHGGESLTVIFDGEGEELAK